MDHPTPLHVSQSAAQAESGTVPGRMADGISLDMLLTNLPGMVYRCLNDGCWTMQFVSAGAEHLTGYRPEDLVGNRRLSYEDLIHPDDRARIREEVRAAIEAGQAFQVSYRIVTAHGKEKWVWEQGNAIHDRSGSLCALEGYVADITGHKRTQDALRESEERFRCVVKATTDAIWDWDLASGRLLWNEEVQTLFGLTASESVPGIVAWAEHIHPEDRQQTVAGIDAAIEGSGQNWSAEYRFLRQDGSYAYVMDRGFVIRDHHGKAVRMVGGMTDLTQRRQTEEEARSAAAKREAIVLIQKEIASADRELEEIMILMAERARELTGAAGGVIELIEGEESVYRAVAGNSVEQIGMRLSLRASLSGCVARSGAVLYCEDSETDARVDRASCRRIDARSVLAAPLRSGEQVIGVLKVLSPRPRAFSEHDVSNLQILVESLGAVIERHRAAERLRASEAQYRLLFEGNPHPVLVFAAADLRILAVNRSAIAHYGYSEPEFLAMTIRELRPGEDLPALDAALHRILGSAKSRGRWRHLRKDGSLIHVEVSSEAIDFNGRPARMVLVNDVTARLRAEQDLARLSRAQAMLSACNEALIRTAAEPALLNEICRVAVEIGGYDAAWVGFAQETGRRTVLPVASFGGDAAELLRADTSWGACDPAGRGLPGQTMRGGRPTIMGETDDGPASEPWRAAARGRGYRSAVCLPLREKERTVGLLTLYSKEAAPVGADEVRLLQSLADNLAFGIYNIRTESERRRLETTAMKVAAGLSASTGTEFFRQLAANVAEAVGAQAGFVAQLLPGQPLTARSIAAVVDGRRQENFDYCLAGTPCEELLRSADWVVTDGVADLFPRAPDLGLLGARAYVGRRLDSFDGKPAGFLFVLFREPLKEHAFITSTLQIFAARAAAELERREADARIREQASLLDKAKDAIVVRGLGNRVHFWNKGAERLYGWTAQEALGRSIEELLYDDPAALRAATEILMQNGEWSGEIDERCKDGSRLTVEANWTLVRDEQGLPQSIFAIMTDITRRKAAEHEIHYLAFYDPLTRLPNRMLLLERLQHALAGNSRSGQQGALLFIDLDNFKTLNDTFGHDMGDLLLQQVAERLGSCVRESDTVARLGGDEFVVMLESLSSRADDAATRARAVGEKILQALGRPYRLGNIEHHSTPSLGITLFDARQANVGELLKRADLAMYQAKAAGRNTMRFFDPEMQAAINARVALEADLRQSLAENGFFLNFQLQVDADGCTTGVEALVRWKHPQRGVVSPADFIPLAEETGLIVPLGQWVLDSACALLASWAGDPLTAGLEIAVNVSARQFRHPDFVDQVLGALDRSGADPARLKLELTESLLLDDMSTIIARMTALKQRGVGFSLDDFGTGYSSLFYLKHLPLDQLKIDQSFVRDVLNDPNDAAIVQTIIALGRSLGLEVIAEGVESEEQREFLARHGCHAYQGYLFSRPMPAAELDAFLRGSGPVLGDFA